MLQWGQTSPAVMRRIKVSELEKFVTKKEDKQILQETGMCTLKTYDFSCNLITIVKISC